jgi:hypothetical protein
MVGAQLTCQSKIQVSSLVGRLYFQAILTPDGVPLFEVRDITEEVVVVIEDTMRASETRSASVTGLD